MALIVTLNIAVNGAGIGGLACALFLHKMGHRVTVYEAVPKLREIGAGIVVPPNMVRLLADLGLSKSLQSVAVQLEKAWEFRRWQDGSVLFAQDMGKRCLELYGHHCYVAHRADLVELLLQSLPADTVRLDHRCAVVNAQEDKVELEYINEAGVKTAVVADAVIGADGIHSMTRQLVSTQEDARFSGLCAFRCLVPAHAAPAMALRPVQTLWLGPGRHFVHYPVSGGKLVNIVAIVPAGDWRTESWTAAGKIEDLASEFEGWDGRLAEMIAAATDTKRWALYDRSPLDSWTRGRVTLLGDAAHAMLPFFAQGAAQAVEDGAVLAECLKGTTAGNVQSALQRYEAIRKPRASEVQLMSRGREVRNHLDDGPEQQQRDRELLAGDPLKQSAWLYGYNLFDELH